MDTAMWDERYARSDYVWTVTVNRFVADHLSDLEPGRAIDLAAGEGRNAVWLAGRGWDVTAVDFSSVGLAKAARLAADHEVAIDLVEADVTTWQPDEPVDLVLIAYLQLLPEDRLGVLARAATWIGPGGTLLVVAHDASNVEHGHGGPPSAAVCYDLDETVAALDVLDVILAEVAERPVETDQGTAIALDTVVLARRPD